MNRVDMVSKLLSMIDCEILDKLSDEPYSKSFDESEQEPTLIYLKKDVIEIVSQQTGEVLHSVSIFHLQDYVKNPEIHSLIAHKNFNSVFVKNAIIQQRVEDLEGQPTIVHWCIHSEQALVGFSSGGIGVVHLDGFLRTNMKSVPYSYIPSTTVHSSDITMLITMKHVHVSDLGVAEKIVIALVGDAAGLLSVWKIYPLR
jgi:hypothetical protein